MDLLLEILTYATKLAGAGLTVSHFWKLKIS